MKKILVVLLVSVIAVYSQAQVMQAKAQWATITVPQLKCWECKDRLEKYLFKEKGPNDDAGIIRWTISMPQANIRIQFLPDRISLDYIRTVIANAGFDADTVNATEDSYKILPPACKRKEEGGGPQKGKPCTLPPDQRVSIAEVRRNSDS